MAWDLYIRLPSLPPQALANPELDPGIQQLVQTIRSYQDQLQIAQAKEHLRMQHLQFEQEKNELIQQQDLLLDQYKQFGNLATHLEQPSKTENTKKGDDYEPVLGDWFGVKPITIWGMHFGLPAAVRWLKDQIHRRMRSND